MVIDLEQKSASAKYPVIAALGASTFTKLFQLLRRRVFSSVEIVM